MNLSPPRFFLKFFRWFCQPDLLPTVEGDLMELYANRLAEVGKIKADRKFKIDVLLLFRPGIVKAPKGFQQLNEFGMFKNYFKVGLRNILKYKTFSFINIFGLSTAMSVCMLLILMLADQDRYDAFNTKKDRVYRVLTDYKQSRQPYSTSTAALAPALKSEYAFIEETTQLTPNVGGDASYHLRVADMRGYFADPGFFKVFSFHLEKGNPATALTAPRSMVISADMARRLFQDEEAIGKTIEFADRGLPFPQRYDGVGTAPDSWGGFTVTGIIDASKYKSHLAFDVLVSSSTLPALYADKKIADQTNDWEYFYRTYTYVLLDPDKNTNDLQVALNNLVSHHLLHLKSEEIKGFTLIPQKLSDIQLNLVANDTNNRLPRIGYYFLASLAAVIMLLACLNYTNLSVARSLTRVKEIGVRKVTGANRKSLVFQFLSESAITAILAMGFAILLLLLIKPAFRGLWVNQYLDFELPSSWMVYIKFVGFALFIGIIAGLYPAFHLSGYQPVKALKNLGSIRPAKLGLRKFLGITQFVISLLFITSAILIYQQFRHFLEFNYGFTAKNIVNIELQGQDYRKLANELSQVPGVTMISACDIIPAGGRNNGTDVRKMDSTAEYFRAGILQVDENFIKNLNIKLIAGHALPPAGEKASGHIVVNVAMAKKLGYANPAEIVGTVLESKWDKELLEVAGVVEDFRFQMLVNRHEIEPLILLNQSTQFMYLNVRVASTDLMATVTQLEERWKRVDPIHAFRYEFFDQQLASTHQAIFDIVSIVGFIAFLAITIACLGLLGMATYTAERKTKEVGIRKVLGAEELSIAMLLSKEFVKLLAMSIVIGAPLSYFANNFWLQNFPNRVDFGWGILFTSILVLVVLGCLTIGTQTWRASRRNPVDALKVE